MSDPTTPPVLPYNRDAIFDEDGPINPSFVDEAVRTLFRALPLDPAEKPAWCDRRMASAMQALAALHPRDEIEIMLGVQALCAYHSAAACWRLGMNHHRPNGDSTRHIASAGSAARTFDQMLKALERRQAKPLTIPTGRPPSREWEQQNPAARIRYFEARCRKVGPVSTEPPVEWTKENIAIVDRLIAEEKIREENEGLDIENTEGILPGGGMILTEDPTPNQQAYMGRRLALMYRREIEENRRKGITTLPEIRPIRPGDLIP